MGRFDRPGKTSEFGKIPESESFFVKIDDYVYSVPHLEDKEKIFLETIMPNSKATKKYFGGKK
jgi:hypothetical protein